MGPHVEDKVLSAGDMEAGKFLGIRVLRAKGLKDVDSVLAGKSDPYFKARIGAKGSTWEGKWLSTGGLRWKSKVVDNNLNPEWNATFTFDTEVELGLVNLIDPDCLELTLRLIDHDVINKDVEGLGTVNISLAKTPTGGEWVRQTLPLKDGPGTIEVELCRTDKPILENVTEKKEGEATTLHKTKDPKMIGKLVTEAKFDPNARNSRGETPLHVQAKEDNYECAIELIINGADVNLTEETTGDTALHIAARKLNLNLVRTLLVFDAKTGLKNNAGMIPFQEAAEGSDKEIRRKVLHSFIKIGAEVTQLEEKIDFSDLEESDDYKRVRTLFSDFLNAQCREPKKIKGNRGRLLSLDAGGVKGVVLTRMLLCLEKYFDSPIINYFDWIIGSSTGALLALALAKGKTVLECQSMYIRLNQRLSEGEQPYTIRDLTKLIYGEDTTMANIRKHPRICVTSVLGNRSYPDLQLFRNYPSPQAVAGISDYAHPECLEDIDVDLDSSDEGNITKAEAHVDIVPGQAFDDLQVPAVPLWKAARAVCALPRVFEVMGPFIDGGLMGMNPTAEIMTEISEFNTALRTRSGDIQSRHHFQPELMVSLGCGTSKITKAKVVEIDVSIKGLVENWKEQWETVKNLLSSMYDPDNRSLDRGRAWCQSLDIPFFRLSPSLREPIEIGDPDKSKTINLMWDTMAYMHEHREEVKAMAELIQS